MASEPGLSWRVTGACAALAALCVVRVTAAQPVAVTDHYPVSRIAGLPAAETARLHSASRSEFRVSVDWSSNATARGDDSEALILDGESVALTARWRRTLGRWRLGFDAPVVYQSGGVLDGVIDRFHDLFDLPEGDRPKLDRDRLVYRYVRDGRALFDVRGHSGGLGDVTLHAARQVATGATHAVAARVHLKLPTGDSDRLLGSGGAALGVGLDTVRERSWRQRDLHWYGGIGAQWSERGEVLGELREPVALYGHGGVSWAWRPAVTLLAQLDSHSGLYASNLRGLGRAIMLSAGARIKLRNAWLLDAVVVEDIAPRTVPDVVFHLTVRRR